MINQVKTLGIISKEHSSSTAPAICCLMYHVCIMLCYPFTSQNDAILVANSKFYKHRSISIKISQRKNLFLDGRTFLQNDLLTLNTKDNCIWILHIQSANKSVYMFYRKFWFEFNNQSHHKSVF